MRGMWGVHYLSSWRLKYACCILIHSNLCHFTLTTILFLKKNFKLTSMFLWQWKVYCCGELLIYLSLRWNKLIAISAISNLDINQSGSAFIYSQYHRHSVDKHSIKSRLKSFLPFSHSHSSKNHILVSVPKIALTIRYTKKAYVRISLWFIK